MKLTIEEKIGQLFLVGITKKENIKDVIKLIEKYHIGGVVIYKNNYSNYDEMIDLVNTLKKANKSNKIPLFISIDQENGRVNRFPSEFKNLRSAFNISKLEKKDIMKSGKITADMLSSTGINMNFAPVLDLKKFEDKHYIGNRAYSSDPKKVYELSNLVAQEHKNKNIIPVLKHFPGHGSIKKDSHLFLPVIDDYENKEDLIPFEYAFKNDADAVMVGHILIKNKTGYLPASISNTFIKEIRNKYNYERLIVSDELSMRSVRYIYGKKKSIFLAANAGVDVIMYKYFNNFENYIKDLIKKYKVDKIDTSVIDDSMKRIMFVKRKYKINDNLVNNSLDINKINEEIEIINKKTDKMSN